MRFKLLLVLVVLTAGVLPASAAEAPELIGRWSAPFWEGGSQAYDPPSPARAKAFPTAVSVVVLPDGRLLYWNGLEGSENSDLLLLKRDGTLAPENSRARILDLRGGPPRWTIPIRERGTTDAARDWRSYSTRDMFCADQKLLYDGTVLIAGGAQWRDDVYGNEETRIFDPETDSFRPVQPMHEARWYPTLVTLGDGRVLATSGTRRVLATFLRPEPAFSQVRLAETYDPSTQRWQEGGVSEWSLPLYPRLHLLPDGTVFYGGAGQTWGQFGETADEATWGLQRVYDPAAGTWTTVGPTRYGVRGGASSALLRLEPPYDDAEILLAGGTLGSTPGTWVATTLSEVVRAGSQGIVNEGRAKAPFVGLTGDLTQLRNRRWFSSTVMLPTGEVLLMNGGDADDVLNPGTAAAVRVPELYDPKTGIWRQMAPAGRERVYHNTAALLPDGRVLVGGNAPHPAYNRSHGNTATRSNNFRDSTFEIYEPPYLFRGPRPVVASVASTGRTLELTPGGGTPAGDIEEVVLVRMPATTHATDADMRAVKLEHTVTGSKVHARLPKGGDGRILPPGPYYVFALRNGVPSMAHVVMVQPAGNGTVVAITR
jgi:galactose oxidase-like protein